MIGGGAEMTAMVAPTGLVTLADAAILVGPIQPILVLLPIIGWAWLVSKVLDKHAARFYLGREKWGIVHLLAGLVAVVAVVFMPVPGWAGFGAGILAMIAILALDIGLFVGITNRDDRVPEHARLSLDFSKWQESRDAKAKAKKAGASTMEIKSPATGLVLVPQKGTPEFELRVGAEEMVLNAMAARASRLDILPAGERQYAASSLIDGVRQPGEPLQPQQALALIDFWKSCAALDRDDRRRKQSAMLKVSTGAGSHSIKLETSGTQAGMRLSMKFDPEQSVRRKPEQLGLTDSQLKTLQGIIEERGGVVLVTAPADSGRTTTLYTLVKMHDAYTSNVQTLEYEIEDTLEGVRQTVFDAEKPGADFATQLRSMLRRDPDVVGVADIPDVQTAQEIAKADLDRTRVYAALRADGVTASLQMWLKAVGDPKKGAQALRGLVAQRLVRKLCDNCRVPYAPPPEMLKTLGLPADKVKQLHKKGGQVLVRSKPEMCPICRGIGYVGQLGVFEVLPLGSEERQLIAEQNWSGLRAQLRKKQYPALAQIALRRAVEGVTSVEEVSRVTSPPKGKGK